ncbi:MAG: 2-succinyl-5-enolpyruvyl-6-hydroxy-3-cyclohexene-1-carboxylic-acid synthase [Myxococcales bacterium]|nr:2-succinyl-5-enolpyruvyl-6-hydroxy-3-cyclohexene-1-carboxylic-acid synthase [Myxococcales bacterium]TDI98899.1 MAG: 2-succinyl-5-enolpyruvyl-6-hydroxy-3-cyclohexene-1-carboxylic-acid synthase [Deltaproteobacteria bacterium]TDJ08580.1 MAG: 2-succinyl-5-enolpyruvyl-6-hydroxy-3-cyclohexene-1-carboxylic-acid synthase [Deltaproteobacteria bacterium]
MQRVNRNLVWAGALADELARCGVRHVCVSPGSRSAPLALSFAAHPMIQDHSILDERAAAFFALGLARASRSPVALVCTSGTATANYLPAVVEAHYSRVPLLLLTADRPPEERECGAGQTIDQTKLYGSYVRLFNELPTPELEPSLLRHVRRSACRAVAAALGGPAGPVHLNLPFREPLAPLEVAADQEAARNLDPLLREGRLEDPMTRVFPAEPAGLRKPDLAQLAQRLRREQRGWLVAGPLDATPELATELTRLARSLGWPVFADALSQLRCGSPERSLLVEAHDAVLGARDFAEGLLPRLVLRFGAMPTSKAYRLLLERHPEITQIVVDPWGWSDPTLLASELMRADPLALARALARELERLGRVSVSDFGERWIRAGHRARRILNQGLAERAGLSEPGVVRTLAQVLPGGSALFVASSMPVRDVDLFWPGSERALRVFANRGANGIDGSVSCALGSALGSDAPLVALIGDLALLHDWSGLLLARRDDIDATLVVIDNNGGGIFEFLPVAASAGRDVFERHFAAGQGMDLCKALRGFGLSVSTAKSADELRSALEKSLTSPGVQLVVVQTDRRENLELHEKLNQAVARALAPTEAS